MQKKIIANHFHRNLMLSSLAFVQHVDGFNYLQFSEMQIQGQPPHYTNGISNTSETKWRWRFKIQRSDTDMKLGKSIPCGTKLLKGARLHVIMGAGSTLQV